MNSDAYPAVIRIDQDADWRGPHLHFDGEDHIAQSRVKNLRISDVDPFLFIRAVMEHRRSGDRFDNILRFDGDKVTPNSYSGMIEYFLHEGKENLQDCLRIAFDAAISRDVKNIVIFTGVGEGPRIAIEKYLSQPVFKEIQLIAVTFPYGQRFKDESARIEISPDTLDFLADNGVPLLRAHLPFDPIAAHYKQARKSLGQDLTLIGNALSIFRR